MWMLTTVYLIHIQEQINLNAQKYQLSSVQCREGPSQFLCLVGNFHEINYCYLPLLTFTIYEPYHLRRNSFITSSNAIYNPPPTHVCQNC